MFPVYVISLADEQLRKTAIKNHLEERGFECEFFDAVDGRQMDVLSHPGYDGPRRMAAHGRHLKGGELGCILSHRGIYQKILDEGHEHVFVIEDDARFDADTKEVLESFLAKNIPYDMVRLLGSEKVARGKHRKILPLYKGHHLVRLRTSPGGTHATLVSRTGAKKLLESTQKFAFPIDTILGRAWETGVDWYSIQPGLAVQDLDFESAIGDDRHDKTNPLNGVAKLKFKLTRLRFKIAEALGKARVYWGNYWNDKAVAKNHHQTPPP